MILAFSTIAFPSAPLAQVLRLGQSWGYEGVELRVVDGKLVDPGCSHAERARTRAILEYSGMPVVCLDSSVRLADPVAAPQLDALLVLASEWGAPLVRVFAGSFDGGPLEKEEAINAAGRVLRRAIPHAEQLGVQIGVETHDAFSASKDLAELLALIPSSWVGAVWDVLHPYRAGETVADMIQAIGRRVLLAQVKDARTDERQRDGWRLALMGEGEVPVHQMLQALHAIGYTGAVSVEWEKFWHPDVEAAEIALPQHAAVIGEWLTELSSDCTPCADPPLR